MTIPINYDVGGSYTLLAILVAPLYNIIIFHKIRLPRTSQLTYLPRHNVSSTDPGDMPNMRCDHVPRYPIDRYGYTLLHRV